MSEVSESSAALVLPARYEPLARLGQGGAGEVWAVRDRHSGRRYALKLLSVDASEGATASLIKEAVALSGLEGLGVPRVITFRTQDSLTLAATALIGGVFSIWGAIVAAVFNQVLPFLFQAEWGINTNFLLIIFGIGLLQVLLTAPGGLAQQFPRDMANLGRFVLRRVRSLRGPRRESP